MRDPDTRMLRIRCMNLEAVNLSKVVEPVIDGKGGLFLSLQLSSAQTGTEEDASSIRRNCADDLEFRGLSFFISNIKLSLLVSVSVGQARVTLTPCVLGQSLKWCGFSV